MPDPDRLSDVFADTAAGVPAPRRPRTANVPVAFDVCHGGVVLRAVLVVHAGVAVGIAFVSDGGVEPWLTQLALAAAVAFPAVLLWLAAACWLGAALGAAPPAMQTAVAVALGALCAGGCWALQASFGLGLLAEGRGYAPARWPAAALAGAAFAAGMTRWLRLRAVAQGPADSNARLAELQSRIRPHFLFNTLNTAIALARVDPARTEGLLEDLAELFRVALAGGDAPATLADELDLARRYLAIEQIRFGERLRLAWDIDDAASGACLPALLLQPLVENAVRHGVEPAADGGTVQVHTRLRRGHAVVTISNSVPAGPPRPGAGMALANVRERLHLMHDVAAQFDARLDGATYRVRLTVPIA